MTRIVKKHEARKNEILDVAQNLFYTQGFDNTSINQIIDQIGIAKGTIYHYFKSKYELLDAVVERLIIQMREAIQPIVQNQEFTPIQKFNMVFNMIGQIKFERKEFMLELIRVITRDENVILHQKMVTRSIDFLAPILSQIIEEGIDQHYFDCEYPDEVAMYIIGLSGYINRYLTTTIIEIEEGKKDMSVLINHFKGFERIIERMIGAEKGSLSLADEQLIRDFFITQED
ncbi:MAG TPA: TetR/AcrR family transcriptional regulator [Candidatus Cloacimonetes bacterium]|nr:TetR/AcrR family transcriptional regulator [Candidatus Cloacimonadota bacterium]HEX37464.1 TetR/AcrR family transcriptional regulator [Candidatus Cloacimonadota bacterium]